MLVKRIHSKAAGYVAAILGIAAVTGICVLLRARINETTIALAMLLVVLFVASAGERGPAVAASVLALACLNYFFLPPLHTFTIADSKHWIALAAFFITALAGGRLSGLIRQQAEEIRDLYAHAPCGYHSLDKDGLFVRINDTELEWLQYSRQEVIGKLRFSDILTPDSVRTFEGHFPQFKAEGVIHDHEFDLVRKDGTTFPVLVRSSAITDAAGNYRMSRSLVYDITERKRAEEVLRENEANLNRAQEIAHIGSWHLDIARNRLRWSDEVFRIFGVPRGTALTYEAFVGMIHPEDQESVKQAWTAALQGAPYNVEHRISVGGELKWVRERAQVEFDKEGNAISGTGTVQDITERKRRENEIRLLALRQAVVAELGQQALRSDPLGQVLDEAVARLAQVLGVDYARVLELLPDGNTLLLRAGVGWKEGVVGHAKVGIERRSQTGFTLISKEPVILQDLRTETRFRNVPMFGDPDVVSGMSVVISTSGGPYGILSVHTRQQRTFAEDEANFLQSVANVLGTMVERRRAEEEVRTLNAELEQRVIRRTAQLQAANKELEQAREREIDIGFRIQQTLLLDQPPQNVPGLRVAAITLPSQRIDGDFYIFIRHSEECLDVIVGDVMGKGIPAALLGAATKSHFLRALSDLMILSEVGEPPKPKDIVMLAHAELAPHLIALESFVTVCYARLNMIQGSLVIVDCGHTGIIHLHGRTGKCEILHGDNLPLGVREGEIYDQVSFPFEPGDLLLFYSDGITEARSPEKELFGVARLEEFVRANSHLEPAVLMETIRSEITAFSQSDRLADDLTGVAIQVEKMQLPLVRTSIKIQSDLKQLRRAREFIRDFCRNLPGVPLDEDRAAALELAVNEAASNIMKHAYHGRADQWIHIEAESFPHYLLIRLHHFGDPFDPSAVPPPPLDGLRESGFGSYIITESVDEARYYRDDRGRNCVELVKFRRPKNSWKGRQS